MLWDLLIWGFSKCKGEGEKLENVGLLLRLRNEEDKRNAEEWGWGVRKVWNEWSDSASGMSSRFVQKIREKRKNEKGFASTPIWGGVMLISQIMVGFSFSCGFWVKLRKRESNGLCFVLLISTAFCCKGWGFFYLAFISLDK